MHFNPEFGTKHLDPCDFSLCVLLSLHLFVFLFSFLPLAQNSEEVCILSASGTAAILNPRYMREGCLDIGCTDHRLVSFFLIVQLKVSDSLNVSHHMFMTTHLFGFCCSPGLRSHRHRTVASVTSRTMSSTCPSLHSSPIVTTVDDKRYQIQLISF